MTVSWVGISADSLGCSIRTPATPLWKWGERGQLSSSLGQILLFAKLRCLPVRFSSSQCLSLFSLFKARIQQGYVLSIPLGSCVRESLPIATRITHLPPAARAKFSSGAHEQVQQEAACIQCQGALSRHWLSTGSWSADDPRTTGALPVTED